MKNKLNKYLLVFILILVGNINIYTQKIVLKTKESGYPAFDKLFRLRWEIEDTYHQRGKILIENGLIFMPGIFEYAVETQTGNKIFFNEVVTQNILRSKIKDSILIVYKSIEDKACLTNIYINKRITSSACYNTSIGELNSLFLEDSLYFLSRDKNEDICINIKRPNYILWKFNSESPNENIYMKYDSSFVFFENEKILLLKRHNGKINWSIQPGKLEKERLLIKDNLYFVTNEKDNKNTFWSLNLKSKEINWKTEFTDEPERDIIEKNDTLFFVTREALLYIDCKTGKIIKKVQGWFGKHDIACFNKYLMIHDFNLDYFPIYTVIERKTGEIKYRYFTSEGFPPLTVENISEEAKKIRDEGGSGWEEGVGHNWLDRAFIDFVEDPSTGLLYGNISGTLICFELIK